LGAAIWSIGVVLLPGGDDVSNPPACDEVYRSLGRTETETLDISPGSTLGRVSIMHGANAEVIACEGDGNESMSLCTLSPSLNERLVAGDWVELRGTRVERVLARRSALRRPDPNGRDVQVLASNLDLVLLVIAIDRGLNVRMLERFAVMAYDSGARPFVVLTKSDQSDNADEIALETTLVVPGVEILTTSSRSGEGIERLRAQLHEGVTAVMLGPSGAGKTSLLNALEGSDALTRTVSSSGEGRHATSTRRLYRLSSGGVLLDIPGIRLVDLLVGQDGVDETFADVTQLATQCRFRDCRHDGDAGCAVEAAVHAGELSTDRFRNWTLAHAELEHQDRRRELTKSTVRPTRPRGRPDVTGQS
jgi:ribosome biogenesis GTPase